jgi:hypothetical protein
MPVRMDARLGEHREVVQNIFSNRTPSFAILSIWGVFNAGWPAQLIAFHRMSSHRMKRTFGLVLAADAPATVESQMLIAAPRTVTILGGFICFMG